MSQKKAPDMNDAWQRMMFKGNKVWLSMGNGRKPVVKQGKVLIKYNLNQDYEYWVNADAVRPIDSSQLKKKPKKRPVSRGKRVKADRPACGSEDRTYPDDKNAVCIYTDGASSGDTGPAGIGVFMRYRGHERKISKSIGPATNNVAELEAIYVGLDGVKKKNLPVRLYTDSGYAYGLLVLGWTAHSNQALVIRIRKLMTAFANLKILKVKGHAGNPGNEMADRLATSAIASNV